MHTLLSEVLHESLKERQGQTELTHIQRQQMSTPHKGSDTTRAS